MILKSKTSTTAYIPLRQRGAVLLIALIVLVAMTLAGIAMMRSVDTGILVSGNMAFRQSATLAADAGINSGWKKLQEMEYLKLKDFRHWTLFLAQSHQCIGWSYAVLKRHNQKGR